MRITVSVAALLAMMAGCAGSPTISAVDRPSVVTFRDGRAYGKVTGISKEFGNIETEFVQRDMVRLGIKPGSHFLVGRADKNFNVFYGKKYGDVPAGEWVAFITADGVLRVARNLENASKTLGCEKGEEIHITARPTSGR